MIIGAMLSVSPYAKALDTYEAFLSEEHFDGRIFSYTLIALMADHGLVFVDPEILCQYGNRGGPYVSSVEIKVKISANFNDPTGHIEKSGSLDIRDAINYCISNYHNPKNVSEVIDPTKVAPTTIILPKISVPQALAK